MKEKIEICVSFVEVFEKNLEIWRVFKLHFKLLLKTNLAKEKYTQHWFVLWVVEIFILENTHTTFSTQKKIGNIIDLKILLFSVV